MGLALELTAVRWNKLPGDFVWGNAFPSAFAVIYPIIASLGEGIFTHGTSGMIGHVMGVGREKALIRRMDASGDVGPPEE